MLKGKIALITGAAQGIGKGIALEYAKQGATVAFTVRKHDERSESLVNEIAAMGGTAKAYAADAAMLVEKFVIKNKRNRCLWNYITISIHGNNFGIFRRKIIKCCSKNLTQYKSIIRLDFHDKRCNVSKSR